MRLELHEVHVSDIQWGPKTEVRDHVLYVNREEAAASNAATVALYDGSGIARLCEQHDIAVMRATLPICIPDLDVLEALRSS